MIQDATIVDIEELFGNLSEADACQNTTDDFEFNLEWPEEIGNGSICMITPREGIILEIGKFRLKDDIAISFEQKHHSISFGFIVSGSIKRTLDSEKGQDDFRVYRQGYSVMAYLPESKQNIVRPSMEPQAYHYVHITIDPLLLKIFMEGQLNEMPVGLRNIVNGAEEQFFYQASIMSPAVNATIQQTISCPYQSSLKRLFLEAKTLELISYSLAQAASSADIIRGEPELRSDDIERVLEARNILIRNLEKPPSLLTLAKQVGTNKNKLNKGFRRIFGTSAFDYLRISRLEQARELLDSKKMNVGEAAAHVGYSHQSSFARAFKNHFGTIPTDHRA